MQNLTASLYTDPDTFFTASLLQAGNVTLLPSLFVNSNTFYANGRVGVYLMGEWQIKPVKVWSGTIWVIT